MAEREQRYIAVLDAGSANVRSLSAEISDGAVRYRGHSTVQARGMRRSIIADLGPATEPSTTHSRPSKKPPTPRCQPPPSALAAHGFGE
jgi:hypothetical protein